MWPFAASLKGLTLPPTSPPATPRISLWRRKRTWLLYAPLTLLAITLLFALLCWHLALTDPDWYHPMTIDDPGFQQLVDDPRLVTDAHNAVERVPLGDQSFTVQQDQLNATITATLSLEAAGHIARDASPVIYFSPGRITLSARVNRLPSATAAAGVITAQYTVQMVDPAPGDPDTESRKAEVHEALTHAIAGEPFLPFFYIPRKRPMVLKDIHVNDGSVTITIGLR